MKRPELVWINALVTVGVILLMCLTKIPLYGAFMIGLAFALAINFKGAKAQAKAVSNHAAAALSTPMILLTTGVFIGVLKNTKMMDAMANMLIGIMPQAIGSHLPIFIGALSGPIGMMLGTDSFFFGFMPLVLGVGENLPPVLMTLPWPCSLARILPSLSRPITRRHSFFAVLPVSASKNI